MDEGLKDRLREEGLLPIEMDEVAQEFLKQHGIDPSTLEVHNSPASLVPKGPYISRTYPRHEAQRRIRENALKMHEMDVAGQSDSPGYNALEQQIREDLQEIDLDDYAMREMGLKPLVTGCGGALRDSYLLSHL